MVMIKAKLKGADNVEPVDIRLEGMCIATILRNHSYIAVAVG